MVIAKKPTKPPRGSTCQKCGFLVGGYHCDCWKRKTPRQSSVERLVTKLRAAGYAIGKEWKFMRCYPGHWQRAAGAWVWLIRWRGGEIGSSSPVKTLLRAERFRDGPWNEVYEDSWWCKSCKVEVYSVRCKHCGKSEREKK